MRFSRFSKNPKVFERPQAEFQIGAIFALYTRFDCE